MLPFYRVRQWELGRIIFWVATDELTLCQDGLWYWAENLMVYRWMLELRQYKISAENLDIRQRKSILKFCRNFIGGHGTTSPIHILAYLHVCILPPTPTDGVTWIFSLTLIPRPGIELILAPLHLFEGP